MSGVLPADEVARIRRDFIGEMGPYGAIRQLAVSHEALRSQLAAAHDVIRRLRKGQRPTATHWYELHAAEVTGLDEVASEQRAVLDAADATPTEPT